MYGKYREDRRVWIDACSEAVGWVADQPEVASDRIALVGYSLGGFVALSTADACMNRDDLPDLQGVVVHWGAQFRDIELSANMPPVRFYHGEEDEIVLVEYARQTAWALASVGVNVDITTYARQGHPVKGRAAVDSRAQTYDFLHARLFGGTALRGSTPRRLAQRES
jgi:predicted esterase